MFCVNICRVSVFFFLIFKAVYHICNPLDPEMSSDLIGESVFKADCSYQELGNGTVIGQCLPPPPCDLQMSEL